MHYSHCQIFQKDVFKRVLCCYVGKFITKLLGLSVETGRFVARHARQHPV